MKKSSKHIVKPISEPTAGGSTNTIVSGSASPGFITDAVNELHTYYTPKAIVDFIKSEQTKFIIGNPPYDTSDK